MEIGRIVPAVELLNSQGEPVHLDDLVDRPTIVQCLRYYG